MLTYTVFGHWLGRKSWLDPNVAADLTGRRILVTGANAGLGFATTRALASRGAHVTMVCRSPDRGQSALAQLSAELGADRLTLETVDLADLTAVAALADRLLQRGEPLHVLVNNAGVMLHGREESPQGHELTFATNVLSGFMLTARLTPLLKRADDARIINVTSGGMYTQRLPIHDLQCQHRTYDGVAVYAQTKRAQMILTEQWAAQLAPQVSCNAMHPGWAATPGVARSLPRFDRLLAPLLRSAEQGADTIIWLAASQGARLDAAGTGRLFFDRKARRSHLTRRTQSSAEERETLWRTCERLTADVQSPAKHTRSPPPQE